MPHLRPDGKTQVTIEYDDDDKPVRLDTVLISTQHDPEVTQDWLAVELKKHVIDPVLDEVLGSKVPHDNYRQLVNPTGSFILGGPAADCRPHRPQDHRRHLRRLLPATAAAPSPARTPTKVDRSAAYACRYVAKNIVAAGLAHQVSRSKSPTLLALPTRYPSTWTTFGTEHGRDARPDRRRSYARSSTCAPPRLSTSST